MQAWSAFENGGCGQQKSKIMGQCLNSISTSVQWGLLRKGGRVFALLGKATPSGIVAFGRQDVAGSWALTSELGCLRLERLAGDEEVIGDHFYLPTPFSYEYGVTGASDSPEMIRAVFGLLPSELEHLVTLLRRGSFPVLGYSDTDLKCSITSTIIPTYWPHVVVSNMAVYGNTVSVEAFVRVLISSLPQTHLGLRYPSLQPVVKQMLKVLLVQRRGIPYTKEMVEQVPTDRLAAK
jgi:hypothetical protein